ncbi:flavin reductase family protein [Pedobacter cryophilus]|uniref:Flavin reductase family protein n=1 Tax=Pedobacter cryophilus TaxID=2571271 RepID=A0A4U1C1B4_9SPHI|nr:flavin reductase family protein [Pedobacter cryophilus]TKB98845.1 flavin reductase family protein [Pedobacter cryophilus]
MLSLNIEDLSIMEVQQWLGYAVAPRPICFASTIDKAGNVNLSPFSFFNIFSSNPPVCVFSPSRRVRDNTTKHTLENVLEVPEVVINIVDYAMVQQTSLASTEYAKGINEFEKAGFTAVKSDLVKPPRVKESPVQLECIVTDVIPLGTGHGAGNLVLAEVKIIHIRKEILGVDGMIDQHKLDLVARLGGNWYSRVTPESLFQVAKPLTTLGIGIDALPDDIKNSKILTGNHLGQLGNVMELPNEDEVKLFELEPEVKDILDFTIGDQQTRTVQLHLKAKEFLDDGMVEEAWKVLLINQY